MASDTFAFGSPCADVSFYSVDIEKEIIGDVPDFPGPLSGPDAVTQAVVPVTLARNACQDELVLRSSTCGTYPSDVVLVQISVVARFSVTDDSKKVNPGLKPSNHSGSFSSNVDLVLPSFVILFFVQVWLRLMVFWAQSLEVLQSIA